jgi:hypothetical protein
MVAERVQVQSRKVIDISQEPLSFRYICSVRAHPLSQTLWLGEGAASPLASHNRVSGPTLETPPRRQREIVVGICRPNHPIAPPRTWHHTAPWLLVRSMLRIERLGGGWTAGHWSVSHRHVGEIYLMKWTTFRVMVSNPNYRALARENKVALVA